MATYIYIYLFSSLFLLFFVKAPPLLNLRQPPRFSISGGSTPTPLGSLLQGAHALSCARGPKIPDGGPAHTSQHARILWDFPAQTASSRSPAKGLIFPHCKRRQHGSRRNRSGVWRTVAAEGKKADSRANDSLWPRLSAQVRGTPPRSTTAKPPQEEPERCVDVCLREESRHILCTGERHHPAQQI